MTTWKITYIDTKSGGRKLTTYYTGDYTKWQIISFFGLNEPDVVWFKLEIVKTK